jgi:nucleotide-binding universal stress UspA family protein
MKFNNILFPIDFSDFSFNLKLEVEWLAKKFNSHVTLMNVFEIPPAWFGMGEAYTFNQHCVVEMLDQAKSRLNTFELDLPAERVTRVMVEGQPALEIERWCQTHPIDLVAMATHGYGAMEGLMMGSVTAKVLHKISAPLWLCPVKPVNTMRSGTLNIICGVELGSEALPILHYARELAQAFNARVTLVHSVPEAETRPSKWLDFDLYHLLQDLAQKELAASQKQAGTTFEVIVSGCSIAQALSQAAAENKADILLIGRGHSQLFMGRFRTHTYDVLSQTSCPVFSYYHQQSEAVGAAVESGMVST